MLPFVGAGRAPVRPRACRRSVAAVTSPRGSGRVSRPCTARPGSCGTRATPVSRSRVAGPVLCRTAAGHRRGAGPRTASTGLGPEGPRRSRVSSSRLMPGTVAVVTRTRCCAAAIAGPTHPGAASSPSGWHPASTTVSGSCARPSGSVGGSGSGRGTGPGCWRRSRITWSRRPRTHPVPVGPSSAVA
ncbi:hypothetical protein [Ornithinimicrobium kibberense]|uniref:hypothetical protein n=1 Tax=Ornithinimicrobium kibberense TaxID=282060 RepID=UPI00361317E7